MILTRIILCLSLLLAAVAPRAAAQDCDSDSAAYSFRPPTLIAPLALTAAGAVGISAFPGFKSYTRTQIDRWGGSHHVTADEYLRFVPAATYLALAPCGVRARSSFRDRLMAGATAYLCMGAVVYATKHIVRETRPDGSDRHSFPSGHVATAFTGAELLRIEYGNAIGAAGYAVAVGVGVLRMYNRCHWYNDVLAGAGIGILCARAGYWLLPLERRLFGLDRRCAASASPRPSVSSAVVAPFYAPPSRTLGLSLALVI